MLTLVSTCMGDRRQHCVLLLTGQNSNLPIQLAPITTNSKISCYRQWPYNLNSSHTIRLINTSINQPIYHYLIAQRPKLKLQPYSSPWTEHSLAHIKSTRHQASPYSRETYKRPNFGMAPGRPQTAEQNPNGKLSTLKGPLTDWMVIAHCDSC